MPKSSLKFLHLSDIHFKKKDSVVFDDIRNEIEREAQKTVDQIGVIDGILISGDIAFSGQPEEYATALSWLEKLCKILKSPPENVWCIPGNHDVNRGVIRDSELIQTIHEKIRHAGSSRIDEIIGQFLNDNEARELIYRPIKNYVSEFASKYNCDINAEKSFIEHDFQLNDGSTLRIRGVNSTIISYDRDNETDSKLAVGTFQSTMLQEAGVEYLLMCHHPYPWLIDYDKRTDHWRSRAKIQLFGHKHRQRLNEIDKCLVVSAGAMQPDNREPDWIPTYNYLDVAVVGESNERKLAIKVFQKNWVEEHQTFMSNFSTDSKEYKEYHLPIQNWIPSAKTDEIQDSSIEIITSNQEVKMEIIEEVTPQADAGKTSARSLTYQFLRLPYHVKMQIVNKLNLIQDSDNGLQDYELFARSFDRARVNDMLAELWKEIESSYKNMAG